MIPPRRPTADASSSDRQSYGQVINVVAGSVTVAAGVLGVSGVTAGVATAPLRNVTSVLLVVMWVIIAWSYIGNASSSSQNAVG